MYAIWNLTNVCPWNCSFCCVSATSVGHENKKECLNFSEKIKVLETLVANNIKIDFSGGDPLYNQDDFAVIERATLILPKDFIDVSITGYNFTEEKLNLLKKVGKVEVSIDNIPGEYNPFRPTNFTSSAANLLKILVKENIFCSAVTTLYPFSAKKENLKRLYSFLCDSNVPKWNILRFYTVGRGLKLPNLNLSDTEILDSMNFLDSLSGPTKIVFQHSLRLLRGEYQCHAANKSFGILPNGIVTACGWALNENSNPLPGFYLGKLPEDDFSFILEKAKIQLGYGERKQYCRITNYLKNKSNITKIKEINCKTTLTISKLPEVDYCINPYIGCLHSCIYCYACFMKRFTNHSEKWGSFLDVKINIAKVLEKELSKKNKKIGVILLGSVTDAYQPTEKKFLITRKILDVLVKFDFPISILTKSELVTRDIDLLKRISDCEVGLTITSLNNQISRIFEPGASVPLKRLEALAVLKNNGIKTYAFIGPILPKITDLKIIIQSLQGKVDFVMFESLNCKKFNRDNINKAYTKAGISVPVFSSIDWCKIEKEARNLSRICGIPVKGFYKH